MRKTTISERIVGHRVFFYKSLENPSINRIDHHSKNVYFDVSREMLIRIATAELAKVPGVPICETFAKFGRGDKRPTKWLIGGDLPLCPAGVSVSTHILCPAVVRTAVSGLPDPEIRHCLTLQFSSSLKRSTKL